MPRLGFLSAAPSEEGGGSGALSVFYERLRGFVLRNPEPASRSYRYMSLLIDREYPRTDRGVCLAFASPDSDRAVTDAILMLAYCLTSELASRVLIIDARLRDIPDGVTGRLGLTASPGFAEALDEGFDGQATLVHPTSVPQVDVLPAGNPSGGHPARLEPDKIGRLFGAACARYDHVLVQLSSPVRDTRAVTTALQADAAFLLARENATFMNVLEDCRKVLADNGVRDVRVLVHTGRS